MKYKFSKLIDVKSIVTLLMTVGLLVLLFANVNPAKEVLALYCTSYGSIITYFFNHKGEEKEDK